MPQYLPQLGAFFCRMSHIAMLYGLLLAIGTMSLAWNFFAMVAYPIVSKNWGRRIGRQAIAQCYRIFWTMAECTGMLRIEASCLDALRNEGGLIIIANHPSMLDALLLVSRLPRSACIMRADLMENIFLGAGARLARYIRNDSALGMVKLAAQDLRKGGQLVVFPEGTRTVQQPLNAFQPGVTLISKLANAPIQTVFIDTNSPYLGKGWPLWRLPALPVIYQVTLGERFAATPDRAAQLRVLENYYRTHMGAHAPSADPTACQAPTTPTSF